MKTDIATKLSKELLHILQHSLGLDHLGNGTPYRNHFVTDRDCENGCLCEVLVSLQFMESRGPIDIYGGMTRYRVTDQGRDYLESIRTTKVRRHKKR